jgi:hypothetical protein
VRLESQHGRPRGRNAFSVRNTQVIEVCSSHARKPEALAFLFAKMSLLAPKLNFKTKLELEYLMTPVASGGDNTTTIFKEHGYHAIITRSYSADVLG